MWRGRNERQKQSDIQNTVRNVANDVICNAVHIFEAPCYLFVSQYLPSNRDDVKTTTTNSSGFGMWSLGVFRLQESEEMKCF